MIILLFFVCTGRGVESHNHIKTRMVFWVYKYDSEKIQLRQNEENEDSKKPKRKTTWLHRSRIYNEITKITSTTEKTAYLPKVQQNDERVERAADKVRLRKPAGQRPWRNEAGEYEKKAFVCWVVII